MSRYNVEELAAHYRGHYASGGFRGTEFKLYTKYFRLLQRRVNGSLTKRRQLIDLGCGNGIKTAAFAQFFEATAGVDLSPSAIDKARELIKDSSITFHCSDIFALGIGKTDVISALGFSYLNEDDTALIAERLHQLFTLLGKDDSVMIMSSFTDFSGTAPSGWVMHSKEQLAALERQLTAMGYRCTLYFPQYDRANYTNFGFLNALKEIVKFIKSRRRTFFVLIEKQL